MIGFMGDRHTDTTAQLPVTGDDASVRTLDPAGEGPPCRFGRGEVLVAAAAFAALCVAVTARSTQLLEPDDYAYRASIIAMTQGHLLSLTNGQYQALLKQLSSGGGMGISQWVHMANGTWISEKNPGYPFLAAPFQALGMLRATPLFYGALGCLGLFFGARRWLGRWGGTWAVVLFCSSGAALAFAWRATMPTFTDAALIAAGSGALLWPPSRQSRRSGGAPWLACSGSWPWKPPSWSGTPTWFCWLWLSLQCSWSSAEQPWLCAPSAGGCVPSLRSSSAF
jgi:hypothetical protein